MILQALCEYYEAAAKEGEIARMGYGEENVSCALVLTREGALQRAISLKNPEQRGKKTVMAPQRMTVPEHATRSSGVAPYFLCDKSAYFLGVDDKGNPARTAESFAASRALHLELLEGVDDPGAQAVCAFFRRWKPEEAREHPALWECWDDVQGGAMLVFCLQGEAEEGFFVHRRPAVEAAWSARAAAQADADVRAPCLVTGKADQPVALIHNKIKGIYGAPTMGESLVGFNAPAFESYGCVQAKGLNAPVSCYAAFAYTTALNRLLAGKHRMRLGDMTVVYWARSAEEGYPDLFDMACGPQSGDEKKIGAILSRVKRGLPPELPGLESAMPFYILGLSPNAGRASVRMFLQSEFGSVIEHIMLNYARLEIVHAPYEPDILTNAMLLRETANPNATTPEPPAPLAGAMLRAVWTDGDYPEELLSMLLLRIWAEQEVTYAKAAMIKAYLLKNKKRSEEEITMALNENCTDRAYVLGRLFAVLEKTQQDANPGGINTTIKDRYFASASATPRAVFPTLLRLARSHIAKAGYGKADEIAISQIMFLLPAQPLPARLTLEEEGMFYLGYYHQNQARYQKKDEQTAKEEK